MSDISHSPYAPIRVRDQYWWQFAIKCGKERFVLPNGQIAANLPDLIMEELIEPAMKPAADEFRGHPQGGEILGQYLAKMLELRHWVPLAAQYELNGRQIFDIGDELVEMLEQTDFGDTTLEAWNPPYDAFYVRFGKRENVRVPFDHDDYEYLDGAFVAVTPWENTGSERRIKFGFMTVKADGRGVMMPGHFMDIVHAEQAMPIASAIDAALARRLRSFDDQPGEDEQTKVINEHRRAAIRDSADILRQAAALLVNSLFYLESVEHKNTRQPGRDTPPAAVVQWAQSPPAKQQDMKSKLTKDGYAVVYLMGQELSPWAQGHTPGARKAAHWRRGHWRNQPHGPKRAELKKIWIKPVMVGTDGATIEVPGHVYVTGQNVETPKQH
jgi:hypothetical protein